MVEKGGRPSWATRVLNRDLPQRELPSGSPTSAATRERLPKLRFPRPFLPPPIRYFIIPFLISKTRTRLGDSQLSVSVCLGCFDWDSSPHTPELSFIATEKVLQPELQSALRSCSDKKVLRAHTPATLLSRLWRA